MRRLFTTLAVITTALVAGAAAQSGKAMPINKSADVYYFNDTAVMTVDDVTLNFYPAKKMVLGDPRKEGKQFVRVSVTVTNKTQKPYRLNYTNFYLQTSDGTRHSVTSSINKGNSNDRLEGDKVDPGMSVSGALYYEVGAKETRETLVMVYTGHKGTDHKDTLITLQSVD